MNHAFDPARGLVVVRAEVHGPSADIGLSLALDTGASHTMVNVLPLTLAGYLPGAATEHVEITTGSGVVYAPRIPLLRISALGHEQAEFPVLAHTLPPSAGIDGLLGLDFMHGRTLRVDFRESMVSLQ